MSEYTDKSYHKTYVMYRDTTMSHTRLFEWQAVLTYTCWVNVLLGRPIVDNAYHLSVCLFIYYFTNNRFSRSVLHPPTITLK